LSPYIDGRPSKPEFDEKRHAGVVIFAGEIRSGASIEVLAMESRGDRYVIEVQVQRWATMVITHSWMLLLIDKPGLPIAVEFRR
jgi:hypothetical protein